MQRATRFLATALALTTAALAQTNESQLVAELLEAPTAVDRQQLLPNDASVSLALGIALGGPWRPGRS